MATVIEQEPFGEWLLGQKNKGGFVGQLAERAATDRAFPRKGDPDAVRKRLAIAGADPEMYEAVDEAEADWRAAA
jgi:hypothetical protein